MNVTTLHSRKYVVKTCMWSRWYRFDMERSSLKTLFILFARFSLSHSSRELGYHLRFFIFFISCSTLFLRLKVHNISHKQKMSRPVNTKTIRAIVIKTSCNCNSTIDYLLLHLLELFAHFLNYFRFKSFHFLCSERGSIVDSVYFEEGILRGRAEPFTYWFRWFGAIGELIVRRVVFVPGFLVRWALRFLQGIKGSVQL